MLASSPARAQAIAHRVVSANLRADQLLLALADDGQIASLSPFAADASMSYFAKRAKAFPRNRGSGEDVISLSADLALVGPYDSRYTRALLEAQRVPYMALAPWTNLAQGRAQIRALAARLGHEDRGEALIASIDAAFAAISGRAQNPNGAPSILVLHRRGFVIDNGIVGELAQRAGFANAVSRLGIGGAGFARLERLVADRPDYLTVSESADAAQDQGQAFLIHPALLALFPLEHRLVLPDRLTICDGPSTPALARAFAAEIDAKVGD
jgi:iron complex transport system substrate-binding protein